MTAALLVKREIAKRLNGNCRADLATVTALAMDGDKVASCANCHSPCERSDHASGITGNTIKFEVILREGNAKLFWPCPGCGVETCEEADLLKMEAAVKEIEADPLCFTCRTKSAA